MRKLLLLIFVIFFIFVLSLPFWLTPQTAKFNNDVLTRVGQLLGVLLIVSLILERSLDIFLTTWRAAQSERLSLKISEYEKKIALLEKEAEVNRAKLDHYHQQLAAIKEKKLKYRSETRVIALLAALIMGILISCIGIRTLGTLTTSSSIVAMADFQQKLFHFMDVLLTGGIIAGGSDGVHKVIDVYRVFMEVSSENAKKAKSS